MLSSEQSSSITDELNACMAMSDNDDERAAAAYLYAMMASLLGLTEEIKCLKAAALSMRNDGWLDTGNGSELELKDETVVSKALMMSGAVAYCMNGSGNAAVYKDIDDCYDSVFECYDASNSKQFFDEEQFSVAMGISYGLSRSGCEACIDDIDDAMRSNGDE